MIQLSFIVEVITVLLSIPVLALSYYWCFELTTSVKYPRDLGREEVHLLNSPKVSILISTFNEKFVIERSLEAMEKLDYPKDKIQVVVADDSTDETVHIIDEKVSELSYLGIEAIVSRRPTRENFKCGALNQAMNYVTGDYVLLLDADSIIPPDILSKGIGAIETHSNASFVSFRYGHYNREHNLTTRLFALAQDTADTTSKMGAYLVDAPFSAQGGFTLVRAKDLREIGGWTNGRIADDTDISIKLYLKGKRGIYLSNVSIMSEDPSTLEAWKKQVARTSQGWWRCIANYWRQIIFAKDVTIQRKLGIFLMLAATFSSLSWILVTFLSAFAIVLNVITPANSVFSHPIFIAALAIPYAVSLLSAAWALKVQGIMTTRNLILIPVLSYAEVSMVTLSSLGFFYGVFDRTGFFHYRTPKSGSDKETTKSHYFRSLTNDRNAIIEGALSVTGLVLGVLVLFHGLWFLSVSMVGFAVATLKSMNLTRHLRRRPQESAEKVVPQIAVPVLNARARMAKPAAIRAKPLLSRAKAITAIIVVAGLMGFYFSPAIAISGATSSSIYVNISSNLPFGGVLVAMQPIPLSSTGNITTVGTVPPFGCLSVDLVNINGTSFCMTVFSLAPSRTIHVHGLRDGYYFLSLSAYIPGGVASANELVNISGSGNYYVNATYLQGNSQGNLTFTGLTPGMEVSTP